MKKKSKHGKGDNMKTTTDRKEENEGIKINLCT